MTVIAVQLDGFATRAEVLDSGHVVIGDEPESVGGTNKGPSPFAMLEISLAN